MLRIALVLLSCATASGGPTCTSGVNVKERVRVNAALDTALKAQGGHVLVPRMLGENVGGSEGTTLTDARGKHWLVIGDTTTCTGIDPNDVMAIDADGNVFKPVPVIQATATDKAIDCDGPPCHSCGVQPGLRAVAVEVPANAKLVKPRKVTVPMDLHIEVKVPAKTCPSVP